MNFGGCCQSSMLRVPQPLTHPLGCWALELSGYLVSPRGSHEVGTATLRITAVTGLGPREPLGHGNRWALGDTFPLSTCQETVQPLAEFTVNSLGTHIKQ